MSPSDAFRAFRGKAHAVSALPITNVRDLKPGADRRLRWPAAGGSRRFARRPFSIEAVKDRRALVDSSAGLDPVQASLCS